MTKAKAKSLIAELIELNYNPMIREVGGNYFIRVQIDGPGVTTAGINNLVTTIGGITARAFLVEFN